MRRLIWLALALLVALLVPFVLGGGDTLARLHQFPRPQLVVMVGMIILCWLINSLRLWFLLGEQRHRMSRLRSLGVVISTEFAMCATPGGSGGPLTMMALLARNGIRPAHASAVFAMDQMSDLVFFLCALVGIALYALFHSLSPRLEWLLGLSAVSMVAAMAGCLAMARFHRPLIRLAGRALKAMKVHAATRRRWARRVLHFLTAFTQTLKLPWHTLGAVFALTSLHWLLRYSVLYLALRGLGGDVQWAWCFLIQMLSLTAGQFSLSPGGAGAAELTSAALLAPMVGKATAAAAILIWRAVTYYFYLLAGAPVFLLMVGKPLLKRVFQGARGVRPAPATASTTRQPPGSPCRPRHSAHPGHNGSDTPRPT
ncbi:MAG: lysylphosphatidylglycerol synthase transmembrane domain-containing protein [Pseudomonas sp.]|uniref:lysylphosphatidylglycerol synthase transmembrane domain-containing protein n=1 Tax=Pseudomonas sp. TaxID=306 RepID=UPI003C70B93C